MMGLLFQGLVKLRCLKYEQLKLNKSVDDGGKKKHTATFLLAHPSTLSHSYIYIHIYRLINVLIYNIIFQTQIINLFFCCALFIRFTHLFCFFFSTFLQFFSTISFFILLYFSFCFCTLILIFC